jgi:hypothetical protein
MPCYDPLDDNCGSGEIKIEYVEVSSKKEKKKIKQLEDKLSQRDAMFCAVINEIILVNNEFDLHIDIEDFLQEATENGKCPDINKWWVEHKESDIERVKNKLKLDALSEHEKNLLKILLA